ncbi:autophagy-related protein 9 [Dunaliella salina]|uniref:Autophagy-related protein 9 n=1 Tax=Dunaliella salina TaxID=3046 RepID=A0ABQ7GIQ8_DUNSA|nr:autophagy-related protein 9 [Dunaliella salina]|eukprot:KAF5834472.1 autophagy-related protein 9 [Dunaliella salina]
MNENPTAYDPERAMQDVVAHTHHLPRQWRGRAHTLEVQQAFNQLFQYKVLLFLEELASVILTPFMLFYTLPQCAGKLRTTGRVEFHCA